MATEAQLANLAKARAAKNLPKSENPEDKPTKARKDNMITESEVWVKAMLTAMRTREVKSPVSVADCVPIADEVLKQYKAKFN